MKKSVLRWGIIAAIIAMIMYLFLPILGAQAGEDSEASKSSRAAQHMLDFFDHS